MKVTGFTNIRDHNTSFTVDVNEFSTKDIFTSSNISLLEKMNGTQERMLNTIQNYPVSSDTKKYQGKHPFMYIFADWKQFIRSEESDMLDTRKKFDDISSTLKTLVDNLLYYRCYKHGDDVADTEVLNYIIKS